MPGTALLTTLAYFGSGLVCFLPPSLTAAALNAWPCSVCCCMVFIAKALTTPFAEPPPMNGSVSAVL